MRKRLFGWAAVACALCMMVGCADPDVGERQVNVIPAPVELVRGEGLFPIGPRTEIGYNDEALRGAAARLHGVHHSKAAWEPSWTSGRPEADGGAECR